MRFTLGIGRGRLGRCLSDVDQAMVLSLDHASLEELNDYFGELCSENTYMAPAPIELGEDHVIPEITKRQAWNSLQKVIKTATG